jgi:hypothetical protein
MRIASTSAEASVNNLVAKRMVKKQQMRWTQNGANLLLQVRVALANGDLAERLAYRPPAQPKQPVISHFVPVRLCCTNRLTVRVPLSPDGLILRLQ